MLLRAFLRARHFALVEAVAVALAFVLNALITTTAIPFESSVEASLVLQHR
jgi:hypothetical protein